MCKEVARSRDAPSGDVMLAGFMNGRPADLADDSDDSGYGMVMFFVFIAAVLGITFAVCVLAVVGSWWMLGAAMAAHVVVTTVVTRVVMGAFGPDAYAYPDLAAHHGPS
jgi:hypothetical protein